MADIQETVTLEWVQNQMKENRVRIVDIVEFTGLHKESIRQYTSGKLKLSKVFKVLLYLYFKHEIKSRSID